MLFLPVPAALLKLPSVLSSNACQLFEEFPTVFDPGKSGWENVSAYPWRLRGTDLRNNSGRESTWLEAAVPPCFECPPSSLWSNLSCTSLGRPIWQHPVSLTHIPDSHALSVILWLLVPFFCTPPLSYCHDCVGISGMIALASLHFVRWVECLMGFVFIYLFCFLYFWDRVCLCISDSPGTPSICQASFKLRYLPGFAFWVLGLKAWATRPGFELCIYYSILGTVSLNKFLIPIWQNKSLSFRYCVWAFSFWKSRVQT